MSEVLPRQITVRYFASLREAVGCAEETLVLPAGVTSVQDLIGILISRGEAFERAFAQSQKVRAALDQVHAKPSSLIGTAREVAFFPPVTGG